MEGDAALRVFSYAVAEKADAYVAIVHAPTAAKERFQLQVRPIELIRQLAQQADRTAMEFPSDPGLVLTVYTAEPTPQSGCASAAGDVGRHPGPFGTADAP